MSSCCIHIILAIYSTVVADIKSQKGKMIGMVRWRRKGGKGAGLVGRLDFLEGGANARKVGMVGKLELFFVMERGAGRWEGNGWDVSL